MSTSSSCKRDPVALRPLEATSTLTSPSWSPSPTLPARARRARRVLYPAAQCRRPPVREDLDQPHRWLLLLSVLVFLQIYTEETHTCTELQRQCPDAAEAQSQDSEGSLGTAQGRTREESRKVQIVAAPSDSQLECVVS